MVFFEIECSSEDYQTSGDAVRMYRRDPDPNPKRLKKKDVVD